MMNGMADIQAFRAIRYPQKDQSNLVAPPYDILNAPEKAALLKKSDRNIVAIDLPHTPPKEAGPDSAYAAAASTLAAWLKDGTLKQDDKPAIYVYHQRFRVEERDYVRKMFFARLRLEEFGKGHVFPHEQTFGGPKEDRLKLTRATRCNLSPIFGLYTDPANAVAAILDAAAIRDPDVRATLDGVESRLWVVSDAIVIEKTLMLMKDEAIFIADGHHRYGTALNYREEIAAARTLAPDDPVNFVLCVFASMEDPGAIIQPTDRVLLDVPDLAQKLEAALADKFNFTHLHANKPVEGAMSAAVTQAMLPRTGPQAIGLFDGPTGRNSIFTPKDPDFLKQMEPNRAPAWRKLSYTILHRYILDEVITPKLLGGRLPTIHYIRKLEDTVAEAKQHRGLAFLMQPCTMTELREVCTAGELMPQKTTYFYPKLATGLVLNPLH